MQGRFRFFAVAWSAFLLALSAKAATVPLVTHGDVWRYHRGTNAPQANWTNAPEAALDATWSTGNGGFGYADLGGQETNNCLTILSDMKNRYTTLYLRKEFALTNALAGDERLVLRMDWDDGFTAWLDGRHLTNRYVYGAPAEPAYFTNASNSHESSLGSGGQPAQAFDLGYATNWLTPGTHTLAVIGLNQTTNSTDFILVPDLYLDIPVGPLLITSNTTWLATNSPYTLTNSVIVASNVTLTIEPGVTVRFRQGCGLTVQGRLLADGTESQPITFTRYPGDTAWERLMFVAAADSRLSHCIIEYCDCVGDHKDYYPIDCGPPPIFAPRNYHEAVVVLASHVDFDSCSFTNLPDASASAEGDALAIIADDADHPGPASANVRGCRFIRIGQGVHTRYASVLVETCEFKDKHGDNDDVDLYGESTPPSVVRSNRFLYPSYDDRINPTRSSALIYGNTIYGSTDHGIVLRDVCRPVVFNNVLYDCDAGGISVQNGCEALIANNTLVNCPNALKMFDHLDRISPPYCLSATSGKATLVNNVIWNSTPAFHLAGNAFGTLYAYVAYCDIQGGTNNANLGSDGVLVGGPGNINLDPLFANAAATNFHLTAGSPCIDAGTNLAGIVPFDFDGIPRPLDGNATNGPAFDLGAYEFLLATADSNGDGIPDGWCQRFGFNPVAASIATDDPDLDGFDNSGEYAADTNPTNALSYFHIETISSTLPVTVSFASSTNRLYTLFSSTNVNNGSWTNVPGQQDIRATSGVTELKDTNAAPENFYRLGVRVP
jgi:hypothetical protein